jgi:hypothetical protein
MGGFLHLMPTAGCQISILIFEEVFFVEWDLYEYPMKNILRTQSSCSLGKKVNTRLSRNLQVGFDIKEGVNCTDFTSCLCVCLDGFLRYQG